MESSSIQPQTSPESVPVTFAPSKQLYIALMLILTVVGVMVVFSMGINSLFFIAPIFVLSGLLLYLDFATSRLILSTSFVTYKRLFSSVDIPYAQINSVTVSPLTVTIVCSNIKTPIIATGYLNNELIRKSILNRIGTRI